MAKCKEMMDTTTDSRVYKIYHRELLETEGVCARCHPRRGCNWGRARFIKKNWKRYRKTQYKII